MHFHFDAVGGVSGNMFIGALLDAFPHWAEALPQQLSLAGFDNIVTLQTQPKNDGVLTGSYFSVRENKNANHHHHRSYRLIRQTLDNAELSAPVKQHALGIFRALAEAEAAVHGTAVDDVNFHEVGAWDSIADVVCAAYLIDCARQIDGDCTWSVSALPLGNGLVQTAHGALPVPPPAVTLLLKGFDFYRDDVEGERVTPTGAAILKYLLPRGAKQTSSSLSSGLRLQHSGYGFGNKDFSGISNVLRVTVFAVQTGKTLPWQREQILQINFEIDDQSGEDIGIALEKLRAQTGVLDVCQYPVLGKKGRMAASVQILAELNAEDDVIAACFTQCTTLGLRRQVVERAILSREESVREYNGIQYRVKSARRPDGEMTAKIAADDLAAEDQQAREALRQRLQQQILCDNNRNDND